MNCSARGWAHLLSVDGRWQMPRRTGRRGALTGRFPHKIVHATRGPTSGSHGGALGCLFRPDVGLATPRYAERLGRHERRQQYAAVVPARASPRGDPRDWEGECHTAPRTRTRPCPLNRRTAGSCQPEAVPPTPAAEPARRVATTRPQGSHPPVHKALLGAVLVTYAMPRLDSVHRRADRRPLPLRGVWSGVPPRQQRGILRWGRIEDRSPDDFRKTLVINLVGPWLGIRSALPVTAPRRRSGVLVTHPGPERSRLSRRRLPVSPPAGRESGCRRTTGAYPGPQPRARCAEGCRMAPPAAGLLLPRRHRRRMHRRDGVRPWLRRPDGTWPGARAPGHVAHGLPWLPLIVRRGPRGRRRRRPLRPPASGIPAA